MAVNCTCMLVNNHSKFKWNLSAVMVFSFIGKTKNKHEKCASTSISFVAVTGSYLPLVVEKGVKTYIVTIQIKAY